MTTLHSVLTDRALQNPASLNPPQDAGALTSAQPNSIEASANDATPGTLDNPAALKKAFADRCNWETLAAKLRTSLEELHAAFPPPLSSEQQSLLEGRLTSHWNSTSIPVCEGSSYYQKHNLAPTSIVKLGTYLSGSDLPLPKTLNALQALYQLATKHVQTPPLGNFSGALSWPIPLSAQDKQAIIDLLNAPDSTLPELPLTDPKGVLG